MKFAKYDRNRAYTLRMLSTDKGDGILPYKLNTIKKFRLQGKIKGVQFSKGGKLWVDPEEIDRFLNNFK